MKKLLFLMVLFLWVPLAFGIPPGTEWDFEEDSNGTTGAVLGYDDANQANEDCPGSACFGIPQEAISTNTTLTRVSQVMGIRYVLTGDGTTLTLPAVSSDMAHASIQVCAGDATAKHVDMNASDRVKLGATALDDGDKLSLGASNEGSCISIHYESTDGWRVWKGFDSAWSDGG